MLHALFLAAVSAVRVRSTLIWKALGRNGGSLLRVRPPPSPTAKSQRRGHLVADVDGNRTCSQEMMMRPTPASAPFDNSAADVILRSSDKEPTDFRTFKLLLSLSSNFFSEIFTLPQPTDPNSSIYSDEYVCDPETPVVQMVEDGQTLQLLLGLCMPISVCETPKFSSLQEIQKVQEAAFKFEMKGVQKFLRAELISPRFIESQPLRVFAIAYRYGWDPEARQAARHTLRHQMSVTYFSELEFMSGATLYKLQEYHRTCGEVASSRALLQPALAEPHDTWTWVTCKKCPAAWNTRNGDCVAVRKWWAQWIENVAKELQLKPWGETARKWDLLRRAKTQADACQNCGARAVEDLETFSQMLSVEIERDVTMVELDLEFDHWSSAPSDSDVD